jgi:type II secretory pathway pseudopilin PulG
MHSQHDDVSGFSLIEVMAATVVATIAVVGLAYTFGMGRGFINRYETDRAAAAAAQGQIELIAASPANDTLVTLDELHMSYFIVDSSIRGTERWIVRWIDDPADGTGNGDPDPSDLRQATVTVVFRQGALLDSVRMTRLLPAF